MALRYEVRVSGIGGLGVILAAIILVTLSFFILGIQRIFSLELIEVFICLIYK